jgi:hypothetical protein
MLPLRQIMDVEAALQQVLLPTSNYAVRGKSLPVGRILKGFRPVMRLRGVSRNTWRKCRTVQKFFNHDDDTGSLQLQEVFQSMILLGHSSFVVRITPGEVSLQRTIRRVWKFRFSIVQVVNQEGPSQLMFLHEVLDHHSGSLQCY